MAMQAMSGAIIRQSIFQHLDAHGPLRRALRARHLPRKRGGKRLMAFVSFLPPFTGEVPGEAGGWGTAIDSARERTASIRNLDIQLDLHAVGIDDEDLMQRPARHGSFAKREAGFLQPCARAFEIACGEREMIEAARFRRTLVAPPHQMHDRAVAEPQPCSGKVEWRAVAIHKAQRLGIKRAGPRKIAAEDRHMIDSR